MSTSETAAFLSNIDEVVSELMTTQEWGLFSSSTDKEKEIIDQLKVAREKATGSQFHEAQTALLIAKGALSRAQHESKWYLLQNTYAIIPLVLTSASTIGAYFAAKWIARFTSTSESLLLPEIVGIGGSLLRAFYWCQFQIGRGQLRSRFIAQLICSPFIGAMLGALAYPIVILSSKAVAADSHEAPSTAAMLLIAAFSGYNWEWALNRFLVTVNKAAGK